MPNVIRVGDPLSGPNGAGVVTGPGVLTVLIGDLPAATMGSVCTGVTVPLDAIAGGSSSVWVGDLQLARAGDLTVQGNSLEIGENSVEAGD